MTLTLRSFHLNRSTFDEAGLAVAAVLATESPVAVLDPGTFRVIDEVLLAGGARFAPQIPLLDSHNRGSVDALLGSVRSISPKGGQLLGTLHFARGVRESEAAALKVRDGHLTDVSVGYRVEHAMEIRPGESGLVNGRTYRAGTRALRVATAWEVKEASLTPIGADPDAKVRSLLADYTSASAGLVLPTIEPAGPQRIACWDIEAVAANMGHGGPYLLLDAAERGGIQILEAEGRSFVPLAWMGRLADSHGSDLDTRGLFHVEIEIGGQLEPVTFEN